MTARNLAAFLGCSTQPVMYQFPNLDTLRDLVYQKADAFHSEYILAGANLLEMGLRYIRFAEEEPNLFRFLFQSGRFSGSSMEDLIKAPEAADILSAVSEEAGLTTEEAATFFEPYDHDTIQKALITIAEGLERGRNQNDETLQEK